MPWESQIINVHGDTALQYVAPEGWRNEYQKYLEAAQAASVEEVAPGSVRAGS